MPYGKVKSITRQNGLRPIFERRVIVFLKDYEKTAVVFVRGALPSFLHRADSNVSCKNPALPRAAGILFKHGRIRPAACPPRHPVARQRSFGLSEF